MTEQTVPAAGTVPAAEEIIEGIAVAVAVNRPRRDLRMTDTIRENLRLDSLALMEVLTRIEEQFQIDLIDDPRVYSVATVGEMVELIQSVIAGE